MRNRQINKLAAFIVLVSVCKKGQANWTALKAFKDKFQKFAAKVELLSKLKLRQEAGTAGIAAQKQQCREEACSAAEIVAAGVRSWAEDKGDLVTAGKVDYSYSDLMDGRDTTSKDRCPTVHDVAAEIVDSLGDHGVDADVLEELQEKIDVYTECIIKPREAVTEGKRVTKQIENEFRAADRLLSKGLDELSRKFKKSAPAFFEDYWNARKIVDTAATHDSDEDGQSLPPAKAA